MGLSRTGVAEEASELPRTKITRVETFLLRTELKRAFGVSVSVPLDKTRSTLLIKVETDTGLVGWGETAPVSGTKGAIDDNLGPKLIGQNPLESRKIGRLLWGANFGHPLAVGGLDIALNDLRGKLLGLPVAELFGGRLRDHVPAYASAMNYVEGEEPETLFPREAEGLAKAGFRAMKMRLGRYPVVREAAVALRGSQGGRPGHSADGRRQRGLHAGECAADGRSAARARLRIF